MKRPFLHPLDPTAWAQRHCAAANLGDRRRVQRAVTLAAGMARHSARVAYSARGGPVKRLFPVTIALTPQRCHSAQFCPSVCADRSGCIRTLRQNNLRTGELAHAGSPGTRQGRGMRLSA